MMGERTVMQEALFYEFNLERHVPADHRLRSIDRFVDLSGIRAARRLRRRQRRRPPGTRSRYAIQCGAVRAGEWFIVSNTACAAIFGADVGSHLGNVGYIPNCRQRAIYLMPVRSDNLSLGGRVLRPSIADPDPVSGLRHRGL